MLIFLSDSPVPRTPSKLSQSEVPTPVAPSPLRGLNLAKTAPHLQGVDIDEGIDELLRALEKTKI